ncbi:bifunctional helix-turn-helix transcriptional regulator/GNAT family N-acetyltransferase [Longimicrobium sp.]|uniref:bifunctional helix-turn-helix transcriptional regulator/GNAT family N-acetyltransferase n=1 Tax=Longimicrobium sp. TaxID=2029185 RepID=UPI003B3A5DF1
MSSSDTDGTVDAVRRFNRFYTRQIGALGEGHLDTPFSLTEARVVYELAQRRMATATELGQELGLDAGYLSRILRGFQERGFIDRRPSESDARQTRLSLTDTGRAAFAQLDAAARRDVGAMLDALPGVEQDRLVRAMGTVERVLGAAPQPAEPYVLRPPRAGDLGWVVQIHGELYDREFGWDVRFEGLIADVIGGYVRSFDPARERCWIAERNGENVGCVFVMRGTDEVAKLRLLIVDPSARGLGIGARLVDECIRFSRGAGYRTLSLWTNSVLLSARRIYQARGFRLVHTEVHNSFGPDLTAETWELEL